MTYTVRRTDDSQAVNALHCLIFPSDDIERSDADWIVWDKTGTPVGFCSVRLVDKGESAFLSRAGLLPCARGHNLQRRMISVRERWAREQGATACITYVLYGNNASLANLIRFGYLLYTPARNWAGQVHYLMREL